MAYWINELVDHRDRTYRLYPDDPLLVVFDIDDTILDLRHAVLNVLTSFDKRHGTKHFYGLTEDGLSSDETQFQRFIGSLPLSPRQGRRVLDWCTRYFWSPIAVAEGHRALPGMLELIAWLQKQPHTFVGLNTGRPESMRQDTLDCLNRLGDPYGAGFSSDLLFMSTTGERDEIVRSKAAGITYFQWSGYRVIAFVDNEPENLQAVDALDGMGQALLLHACTEFKSSPALLPKRAIRGLSFESNDLIKSTRLSHATATVRH